MIITTERSRALRRSAIVVLLLSIGLPVFATGLDPATRVEHMQRAIDGDLLALQVLQGDEAPGRWSYFYRGFALHAAGRDREAVEAWREAAKLGHNTAPTALAWHHGEREQWLEAYAWARVAMEVDAALRDLELDDLRGSWSLYTAVQAAEALDDDQHEMADATARGYLADYLDALVAKDLAETDAPAFDADDVVERRRPVFPRSMWENGRPGWAYLYFEIQADGRVGEIVPIASHPRFGRAAARAVKKWRFDTEALNDLPKTGVQMIEFSLSP